MPKLLLHAVVVGLVGAGAKIWWDHDWTTPPTTKHPVVEQTAPEPKPKTTSAEPPDPWTATVKKAEE